MVSLILSSEFENITCFFLIFLVGARCRGFCQICPFFTQSTKIYQKVYPSNHLWFSISWTIHRGQNIGKIADIHNFLLNLHFDFSQFQIIESWPIPQFLVIRPLHMTNGRSSLVITPTYKCTIFDQVSTFENDNVSNLFPELYLLPKRTLYVKGHAFPLTTEGLENWMNPVKNPFILATYRGNKIFRI